uniref:hypothetical protein n=1 Tax=Larkinella soli TaxID=1770527 RepID=UPI0019CF7D08
FGVNYSKVKTRLLLWIFSRGFESLKAGLRYITPEAPSAWLPDNEELAFFLTSVKICRYEVKRYQLDPRTEALAERSSRPHRLAKLKVTGEYDRTAEAVANLSGTSIGAIW